MRHVGAEVAANDAVPCGAVLAVKVSLRAVGQLFSQPVSQSINQRRTLMCADMSRSSVFVSIASLAMLIASVFLSSSTAMDGSGERATERSVLTVTHRLAVTVLSRC